MSAAELRIFSAVYSGICLAERVELFEQEGWSNLQFGLPPPSPTPRAGSFLRDAIRIGGYVFLTCGMIGMLAQKRKICQLSIGISTPAICSKILFISFSIIN